MKYFDYENDEKAYTPVSVSDLKNNIGKYCVYLTSADIDKSGRGYFFPRYGTITNVSGRRVTIDGYREIEIKSLKEIAVKKEGHGGNGE